MTEYRTIGIPKNLADKLEKIVGHAGYRSLTEIIMYAIRSKMYEFDNILEEIKDAEALATTNEDKM